GHQRCSQGAHTDAGDEDSLMLRIFIGYDPRQPISYHTLAHSIIKRTSIPVSIAPIGSQFVKCRSGLTPFTFARFLVPWLCGFEGKALFLDADELVLGDIAELFGQEGDYAVWVSKNQIKFEWASVMLFNCDRCRILTPEYVNTAQGLHSICWTEDIGPLPAEWNHLVGYDNPRGDAKLVHFTQGVPHWWWTEDCEYAEVWKAEAKE